MELGGFPGTGRSVGFSIVLKKKTRLKVFMGTEKTSMRKYECPNQRFLPDSLYASCFKKAV